MTTNNNDNFSPFYRDERLNGMGEVLAEYFADQVFSTLALEATFKPFVGLKYFKQQTLPRVFNRLGGVLISELILEYLITSGKLKLDRIEDTFSGHSTLVVSLPTIDSVENTTSSIDLNE